MDQQSAPYADMGLPGLYEPPVDLDDIKFDDQDDLFGGSYEFPEFPNDDATNETAPKPEVPTEPVPATQEPQPGHAPLPTCVDPRQMMGNSNSDSHNVTNTMPQQQVPVPTQYPTNYGSHVASTDYTIPNPSLLPQGIPQWNSQWNPQQHNQPLPLPVQYPSQWSLQQQQEFQQFQAYQASIASQGFEYPQVLPPPYAPQYDLGNPPQATYSMPLDQQPFPDALRVSNDSSVVNGSASTRYNEPQSKLPAPKVVYHSDPRSRPETGRNGEPLRSGRIPRKTRKNQARSDPQEWYGPPPPEPESWGPIEKSGRPLFKYTACGELERGKMYSKKEMRKYIFGPKTTEHFQMPKLLPGVPEFLGYYRQGLTLWIGWVPAQSNDRYPYDATSQKCRFADCPDPRNTIRAGLPRVVFDERYNCDGDSIDVFHNAGYAHLFCLERHFNLISTMQVVNVQPDEREFHREDNLCKITRQFPSITEDINEWYEEQYNKHKERKAKGISETWVYKDTLSYRLVKHAVDHLPDVRAKVRRERAGADISKHMGDLYMQNFLNECKRLNLLDEKGDPVPNAKEQIKQLGKRGRSKAQREPITPGSSSSSGSSSSGIPTPSSAYFPVSPLSMSTFDDVTPMTPVSASLSWASTPSTPVTEEQFNAGFPQQQSFPQQPGFQLQQPPPPVHSAHKRTHDEMYAEDQEIGGQAAVQKAPAEDNPPKRAHIEESTLADTGAAVAGDDSGMREGAAEDVVGGFDPESGQGDKLERALVDELQLDHEAGFDIIDNEFPGKSPSPGICINENGFDLFGDVETPDTEEPSNVDANEEPPGE
ncbi:hypothetical protein GGR53DRAFT_272077 [Hypoxylon sp. FL1150]|nr:hypothetical protein GGR53DRAFT_272077 [Hypoxylon sp. FL1150]